MNKKLSIPVGTRDLVLNESKIKRHLSQELDNIFNSWGYDEVITPTIEFYNTFNPGFKYLEDEEMYKFFDQKGRILVLRPDMTIPIARVAATRFKETNEPLRFRHTSNIFHANNALSGRKNEFTDCGVELIGASGIEYDVEILVTALESLSVLKDSSYKLELGNVNIVRSVLKDIGLNEEQIKEITRLIDKRSIKSLNDYIQSLDLKPMHEEFLSKLPWMFGDKNVLVEAKKYEFNNEYIEAIEYLEQLLDKLCELGYENLISFDLGMVHRLNYYSGLIFRGYVDGVGLTVLSGGRYDTLLEIYGKEFEAIGFAVKLDALMDVYTLEQDTTNNVTIKYGKTNLIEAIKVSNDLRKENKIVKLILDEKLNKIEISEDK